MIYSQDYKINPDFIVGYIDVNDKKIVVNPKYNRNHDYTGLVEDMDIYRENKELDNDKIANIMRKNHEELQSSVPTNVEEKKKQEEEIGSADFFNSSFVFKKGKALVTLVKLFDKSDKISLYFSSFIASG